MKGVKKMVWGLLLSMYFSITVSGVLPEGWRWYREGWKPSHSALKKRSIPAINTLQRIQERYQYLVSDAVLHPNDSEKVGRVMQMQRMMMQQSDRFGRTWQRLLYQRPELDETVRNPTQHRARQAWIRHRYQYQEHTLHRLGRQGFGLLFVYKSDELYAQIMAPSLQRFAQHYAIPLLGIVLDKKGGLSAIAANRLNQGRLAVPAHPALLMVHMPRQKIVPLTYGFTAIDEVVQRILKVLEEEV